MPSKRRPGTRSTRRSRSPSTARSPIPPRRGSTSLPDETRTLTYSAALNEALREEMLRDDDVFLMGQDIAVWGDGGGVFSVTKGLHTEFGDARVRDTPISEEGTVAMAVGAAISGTRPVVELMYS